MLTLCIDTSYKYLTCALIENDELISYYSEECFKKQSEMLFGVLKNLFDNTGIDPKEIDSVCVTKGPGSYTGVRIAITLAKTACQVLNLKLYTISTLRLYASKNPDTMVIMDARAKRAYYGLYDGNEIVIEDSVDSIDAIDVASHNLVGDCSLFGRDNVMPNIAEAFLATKDIWEEVDDIPHFTPVYLKESESYYR